MKVKLTIASVIALALCGGVIAIQQVVASKIVAHVEREMPRASGISASMPLVDLPSNLSSKSIKSVHIKIDSYLLKQNNTNTSLEIAAKNISRSESTLVGSLAVTATISESTIVQSSQLNDAQIVGDTLQVSAGAGGIGKVILVPKYSNSQLYFEIQGVSYFGNVIPATSLPAGAQEKIRARTQRKLSIPKGLAVQSVSLSNKGLSLSIRGTNIRLSDLGSEL